MSCRKFPAKYHAVVYKVFLNSQLSSVHVSTVCSNSDLVLSIQNITRTIPIHMFSNTCDAAAINNQFHSLYNVFMVDPVNRWVLVQSRCIGSFDLPWSEWSRITDPDPDYPKGKHPLIKRLTSLANTSCKTSPILSLKRLAYFSTSCINTSCKPIIISNLYLSKKL